MYAWGTLAKINPPICKDGHLLTESVDWHLHCEPRISKVIIKLPTDNP